MTSTAMGRCFFVLGTYLANSIFNWFATDTPNNLIPRSPQAEQDRIADLPGLDYDPGFEQFAGYLNTASEERKVFYWYVESQSSPQDDPVILWTSGGPGCSGLLGLGTEHGPFFPTGGSIDSNQEQKLQQNFYSWNQIANVLYIEVPAGVGFSYTDKAKSYGNDAQTALDNYYLILSFLERFPERQDNGLYLASESYGGHYIPQLALEILKHDPSKKAINFEGFLVGNPYVDPYTNTVSEIESYYSHGLLAKPLFDQWKHNCQDPLKYETKDCKELANRMFEVFSHGINPYALDYPVCHEKYKFKTEQKRLRKQNKKNKRNQEAQEETTRTATAKLLHWNRKRMAQVTGEVSQEGSFSADGSLEEEDGEDGGVPTRTFSSQVQALLNGTGAGYPYRRSHPFQARDEVSDQDSDSDGPEEIWYKPCSRVHLEQYLNRPDVREALHVRRDYVPNSYGWSACGGVQYSSEDVDTAIIHLYQELVDQAKAGQHELRMLVFSGDDDSICSTAGTQRWIWNLGVEPDLLWKPWKVLGQTAGFVTTFEVEGKASFAFATVHGAGHEVPAYRPMEALILLDTYLKGIW